MKINLIVIAILLLVSSTSAQLKVFSGGALTIGNTTAPPSGIEMHVQGNSIFTTNSFSTSNSAAYIRGLNGFSTPSTPDYTWYADNTTGFFHPANQTIGFAISTNEVGRFNNYGHLLLNGSYDNNFRLSITCIENEGALVTSTNHSSDYGYAHASYVNLRTTKNWVVLYNEFETFYVNGNGDVWSHTNYYSSDSVLKENVHEIQDAKTKILSLRGVTYNFTNQPLTNANDTTTIISHIQQKTQIGLIAQEVERVVPEVVETNDHGRKGIAYQNLVALLIEGFKQQNDQIQDLQNQMGACCATHLSGSSSQRIANSNEKEARLDQNKPNPFNTSSKINFLLPENASTKKLLIFDMQGLLLKQYNLPGQGEGSITIEASEYKPGMYLYSLIIGEKEIDTKRMILTK